MENIIQEYRILVESLPGKIKNSSFKPQAIMKMSGIPSATF